MEVSSLFSCVWKGSLMEVPMTVEGIEELVSNKDDEKPDDPGCNVGNGAQDPVVTRTRHSRGIRIWESRHSIATVVNQNEQKGTQNNSLNQNKYDIEVKKHLDRDVSEDNQGEQIKVDACLLRWIMQQFKMKTRRTELGLGHASSSRAKTNVWERSWVSV